MRTYTPKVLHITIQNLIFRIGRSAKGFDDTELVYLGVSLDELG